MIHTITATLYTKSYSILLETPLHTSEKYIMYSLLDTPQKQKSASPFKASKVSLNGLFSDGNWQCKDMGTSIPIDRKLIFF